jgi:hypothetical protein
MGTPPPPPPPPEGPQPPYGQPPPPPPQYGHQPPPYPPQYGGYPPQPGYGWQPPPYQPPPRIDPSRLRPSRLWYWLSPIPAVVGIVVAVLFVVALVDRLDPHLNHFSTGSGTQIHLTKDHERAIYVQTAGSFSSSSIPASELSCTVRRSDNEADVPVHTAGSFTLTVNSDEYISRFRFNPPVSGDYDVKCDGPSGVPLAVGPHFSVSGTGLPILGAIVSFLIGAALTAAIAIVTGVKRSSHRKRLQQEALQGR